ncbi:uncharacterized protein LOC134177021 [Corticium candelabrum]|uniref:uncharacterized protein LOC134177021 n=1 Tax=Corticium candelabrum TaxID=121492 RepID=UPI002E25DDC2|nr:uncharacterized protein LOC134177021 [Corticium candelabrum]
MVEVVSLSSICEPISVFWGESVVEGQVDFSPCFEDTALLIIPCFFLFLIASIQLCFGDNSLRRSVIPTSKLHVIKSECAMLPLCGRGLVPLCRTWQPETTDEQPILGAKLS